MKPQIRVNFPTFSGARRCAARVESDTWAKIVVEDRAPSYSESEDQWWVFERPPARPLSDGVRLLISPSTAEFIDSLLDGNSLRVPAETGLSRFQLLEVD